MACSGVLKVSCTFDIGSAVLVHPIKGFDHRSCKRHKTDPSEEKKTHIRATYAST